MTENRFKQEDWEVLQASMQETVFQWILVVPPSPTPQSEVARRVRWNDWETVVSDFSIVNLY